MTHSFPTLRYFELIAVGDIHRCAAEHAFALEIGPLLLGQHLEGRRGGHSDGVSVAGVSTAASSLPSTASSSHSSISAAETTCSLFATSNRRTTAQPRPRTPHKSSPLRKGPAWS